MSKLANSITGSESNTQAAVNTVASITGADAPHNVINAIEDIDVSGAIEAAAGTALGKIGGAKKLWASWRRGTNKVTTRYADGTFSVSDWNGYPAGVPRPPEGSTYRLLTGSEYTEARRLVNNANAQIRRSGVVPERREIHEIIPVKYGGSPTNLANKVYLPRGTHRSEVTPWWNRLQRDLER